MNMTVLQQFEALTLGLCFSAYILYKARETKLNLRYAIIWLIIITGLLTIAVFPGLVLRLSSWLGFAAGTNFLFIAAITALAYVVFRLTCLLSEMERRVVRLSQTAARLQFELNENHSFSFTEKKKNQKENG